MLSTRSIAGVLSLSAMMLGAGEGSGQDYPSKPVRIVTSPAGSGNDFTARLIADGLKGSLSQAVIVDNRPGNVIPGEVVSKSAPDGYTLLVAGGTFLIGPLLEKTPYDPVTDFSPITLTGKSPAIVLVHPSLPARSVKELIALAKSRPGELNYASGATGASNHLAAELFKSMAGVNIVRVPYKSSGQSVTALIAGEVQLMIVGAPSVAPHVKSGRLRALAVTTAEPSVLAPGLPTISASGLPGYVAVPIDGMFAPAKTPSTIIARLNQEIVRELNTTDVKERLLNAGTETGGSSPEQFAIMVKTEIARWGKLIKDAGIRAD